MEGTTVLKVCYQKVTRRVPIHPAEWDVAEEELRSAFGNLPEKFALTYVDDEKDIITVNSNSELQEAFRILRDQKNTAFKFDLVELKTVVPQHDGLLPDEKIQRLQEKIKKIEDKKKFQEAKAKAVAEKKLEKAIAKAEKIKQRREEKEKKQEAKALLKQVVEPKEASLKQIEVNEPKTDLRSSLLKEIRDSSSMILNHVEPTPRPEPVPLYPILPQLKNAIPVVDDEEEEEEEEFVNLVDEDFCFVESPVKSAPIPIPEIKLNESVIEDPTVAKLKDLRDMGFTDDEKNLELLVTFSGDLVKVVAFLLQLN